MLYKGENNGCDSVTRDVEASGILRLLKIPALKYDYAWWDGKKVSASKCYTSSDTGEISAGRSFRL